MIVGRDPILAAAINLACKDTASRIIYHFPNLDRELISSILGKVMELLQENVSRLSQSTFAITLDFSQHLTTIGFLNLASISNALAQGIRIFVIDSNLNILSYDNLDELSDLKVSLYSQSNGSCVIYISGVDMLIFAKGSMVEHINYQKPLMKGPTHLSYSIDAHSYDLAIKSHFQKIRFGGLHSEHWFDRDKRILKAKPIQTENHFHRNLWRWLDANLNDADVLGEVRKITNDRTDIEIRVRRDGKVYIIEVKWLGINESGTEYKEDRICDGIKQVNNYIRREKFQSEVCLVAYDARKEDEFNALTYLNYEPGQWKEIKECQGERLEDNGKGFVFFLESKTASNVK